MNGSVDPNSRTTTYFFEYGTTTSYGAKTSSSSAGSGRAPSRLTRPSPGSSRHDLSLPASSRRATPAPLPAPTGPSRPSARRPSMTGPPRHDRPDLGTPPGLGQPGRARDDVVLRVRDDNLLRLADGVDERRLGDVDAYGLRHADEPEAGVSYHFRVVATNSSGRAAAPTRRSRQLGRPRSRPGRSPSRRCR